MRLIILSGGSLDWFGQAVLETLAAEPRVDLVGAVVDSTGGEGLGVRIRKELSRGRGGYVAVMSAAALGRRLRDPGRPAVEWFAARGVPTHPTADLYARDTIDFIAGHRPDAIFRTGFGIIREPVLSLAPRGILSYHHGDIRAYRGAPYGFWELLHGERSIGVTVQILSSALDAGCIVVERRFPIERTDTWRQLRRRVLQQSVNMAHEACLMLEEPEFEPLSIPVNRFGKLYTLPNLRTWLLLQARVAWRRAGELLAR